jgi:CelD/BcsL family acetyltransferase involved in cellulose biosynthesis
MTRASIPLLPDPPKVVPRFDAGLYRVEQEVPISSNMQNYSLSALTPELALGNKALRGEWESLMNLAHPLNRVFASPTLYEHRHLTFPAPEDRVFVLRDQGGKTIGVCPVVYWRVNLTFQIRKRVLGDIPLKAATVYGGEPLVPPEPELYRLLFQGMLAALPWSDCLFFPSMPVEGFACRYLYSEGNHSPDYFVNPRRLEPREWVYLEPGASLASFLEGKHKRTRNTLKRRVRKLKEHGGGSLQCQRVDTEDQVDAFYESALSVAERSWQFHNLGRALEETALYRESLHGLARLGCLRAYLLKSNDLPCAFVIGCQYQNVLQFEQTAYAADFAAFSPGTVLYYLMLEDLYTHRPPSLVNHGVGVTPHKRLFTNQTSTDATVYLFRRTLRNRVRALSHGLFSSGVRLAKRLKHALEKRPVGSGDTGEDDERQAGH